MNVIIFIAGVSMGMALMLAGDAITSTLSDPWLVVSTKIESTAWILVHYFMPTLSVLLLAVLLRRTKKD